MESAIATLKDQGYRVTAARVALLESLSADKTPLTIPELAARTASNEASVYRNLEVFRREGLVEAIHSGTSLPRFALAHEHHDHVVCTSCGFTAHLPCTQPTRPEVSSFARITSHEVTFLGICNDCTG